MSRKWARIGLVVVGVLAIAAGGGAWWGAHAFTAAGPAPQGVTLVLPRGAGTEAIAARLEQGGVIAHRWVFIIASKLARVRLKAGEYAFPAHVSAEAAMRQIAEGRVVIHKLTVAEGVTVRQVLAALSASEVLSGTVTRPIAEGSLLPETWHLVRDTPRDEVVGRMEAAMRRTLAALWAERDDGLPLRSPEEALVLASIVERETAVAAERPRVAAVFLNRLARGMRLQSDPTVIYGISGGEGVIDRPISRDDLANPHPWNTYVIDGLPPTPIANPGRAAIEAVVHPARGDDLYFVADGSGGHAFSRTLDEHLVNVARWRRIERGRTRP